VSAPRRRSRDGRARRRGKPRGLLRLFEAIWDANARGDQHAVATLVLRAAAVVMQARQTGGDRPPGPRRGEWRIVRSPTKRRS